ncbi:MAG TPA: hypothetical protein VGK99_06840 [Acidobacteriota bacterium]|jgi:Spy/CpxP family protein refolding chaperone
MSTRLHAVLILGLVFVLGCISGAGGVYVWLGKTRASSYRGNDKNQRVDLEKNLRLSEQQKVQFEKIMDESRGRFSSARAEATARFDGIRNDMRQKIRAILTEEQDQKFEAFLKEKDQERKKFRRDHR